MQERTVRFLPGIVLHSLSVSQCIVARTSTKVEQSYKFAYVVGEGGVGKGLKMRIKIGFKEPARIFVFCLSTHYC